MKKKRAVVQIFYFDAGAGHRSAMCALKEILALRHPEWSVMPVDLQKILEPVDPFHKISQKISPPLNRLLGNGSRPPFQPIRSQDFYNFAMRNGARGFSKMLPLVHEAIRKRYPQIEALLQRHWLLQPCAPSLVVSVIPNFNGVIYRALCSVWGKIPFVTILTDLVEREPDFWMEDQDQIVICGTSRAARQARATGYYAPQNIIEVSGMLLNKAFYEAPAFPLAPEGLGLSPGRMTALVLFGGNGSMLSKTIVDKLRKAAPGLQLLVLCGTDKKLFDKLQHTKGCCAVGFVPHVADYMRLADFMIGKPGPGCLSEALHMSCPVIVERNAATLAQEKPNADWILEKRAGIVVQNFGAEIAGAVRHMMENLDAYRRNIAKNIPPNRALFEVADVFERLLSGPAASKSGALFPKALPPKKIPSGWANEPLHPDGSCP